MIKNVNRYEKFLFVLSWLRWASKMFMLHKTRVAIRFRSKKPSPQTTRNFALVCLWCGRTVSRADGRCTVTWLPNFLGWVVYHIFLPMVLRWTRFGRKSSAIKILYKLRWREYHLEGEYSVECAIIRDPGQKWILKFQLALWKNFLAHIILRKIKQQGSVVLSEFMVRSLTECFVDTYCCQAFETHKGWNSPGSDSHKIMARKSNYSHRRLLYYVCFLFSALVFWTTSDQLKEH